MTTTRKVDIVERLGAARQRQPIDELRRKAAKAVCRSRLWTQEEIDLASAEAREMARFFSEDRE